MVIKEKSVLRILFFLFFLFSLAPNLFVINEIVIKPMYLIFVLLFLFSVKQKKLKLPNIYICLFFFYFLIQGVFTSGVWGIERLFFNYSFGFVVLIIFLSLGGLFSEEEWMKLLQIVWLSLIVFVLINDLRQSYRFVEYVRYDLAHPYITTIVTGGVNIEASWLAILSMSFYNSSKRWWPLGISAIVAAIYASRASLLAILIVLFVFVFGRNKYDNKKKIFNRKLLSVFAGVFAIIFIFSYDLTSSINFLERFTTILTDKGSMGRLNMWRYVFPTVEQYPLGVGLGNSMAAVTSVSNITYLEDNLHNIFLQMLVDLGVGGVFYYIALWFSFIKREYRNFFSTPIVSMLFIYLILALLQFKGGETIFFCILGIYLSSSKRSFSTKKFEGCEIIDKNNSL